MAVNEISISMIACASISINVALPLHCTVIYSFVLMVPFFSSFSLFGPRFYLYLAYYHIMHISFIEAFCDEGECLY